MHTFLIFAIAYGACKLLKLSHKIDGPTALATTVGVLTEVTVMLFLVILSKFKKITFNNFP